MSQKRTGVSNLTVLLSAFAVGVFSIRYLEALWPAWSFVLLGGLSLLINRKFNRIRWLPVFLLGFCWAGWVAQGVMTQHIPADLEKKDLVVGGTVASLVQTTARGLKFKFEIDSMSYNGESVTTIGLVGLRSYTKDLQVRSGDRWQFTVRLKRPHGLQNPGSSFNYETWLFQQRIRAMGYIVAGQSTKLAMKPGVGLNIDRWINTLRRQFSEFIKIAVGPDGHSGVIAALTVGIRHQLSDQQWQVLQNTGTIHLVAISGLHIGLISALGGFLGAGIWRRIPGCCRLLPAISAGIIVGLFVGIIYAILAGLTVPTRRAIAMLGVVALIMLLKRKGKPLELLILVLAIILAIDPLAPLSSSFWLSFGAVSILVIVATRARSLNRLSKSPHHGFLDMLFTWSRMQLWLLFGMLPVLMITFHKFSLIAPFANLVAVPVIGMVVVPISLLALVTFVVGQTDLASVLLELSSFLLDMVWQFLAWLALLPGAIWQQGEPPLWTIGVAIVGVLLMSKGRLLPVKLLSTIWFLPMFMVRPDPPLHGEFIYTMLDVGQGLASVIQTAQHTLVYDTGAAYPSGFNLGKVAVVPYLRYIATNQIDRLIISHGDNDHIGGALLIASNFDTHSVITSASESKYAPPGSRTCVMNQSWHWDGVDFEILWPAPRMPYVGNNSSCVLKVSSINGSILLTGDIEAQVEQSLVGRYGDQLDVDVLQIPHHGSRTSSSLDLINAVQPRLAMVSAGYLNRYRHPDSDLMRRYTDRHIDVLNTAEEGALTVEFKRSGIGVSGQRSRSPKFWQMAGKTEPYDLEFIGYNPLSRISNYSPIQ